MCKLNLVYFHICVYFLFIAIFKIYKFSILFKTKAKLIKVKIKNKSKVNWLTRLFFANFKNGPRIIIIKPLILVIKNLG